MNSKEHLLRNVKKVVHVGLLTSSLGTAACGSTEGSTQPAELDIATSQAIYLLYPFLDQSTPIRSIEKLSFDSKIPTVVANFTDYSLNKPVIEEIYRIVDFQLTLPLLTGDGTFTITPRPRNLNYRTSVITPEGTQHPCLYVACTVVSEGSSNSHIEATEYFKGTFFDSELKATTLHFAIEACQQSLRVEKMFNNVGRYIVDDPKWLHNGQEVLCNSAGISIAARLIDIPYQTYKDFAQITYSGENNIMPLIIFPEEFYYLVKPLGTVI